MEHGVVGESILDVAHYELMNKMKKRSMFLFLFLSCKSVNLGFDMNSSIVSQSIWVEHSTSRQNN
jgi:hypothetical protein